MNRLSLCMSLAAAALLAGCASAPQAENPQAAVQLGFIDAQPAAAEEGTAENLVIQGQIDAQNVHPNSEVVCRDMLQHASNTIKTRCMTVAAWKSYQAAEAQRAQAIVRGWQGSPYAGF